MPSAGVMEGSIGSGTGSSSEDDVEFEAEVCVALLSADVTVVSCFEVTLVVLVLNELSLVLGELFSAVVVDCVGEEDSVLAVTELASCRR